jgi:hypothetical protein
MFCIRWSLIFPFGDTRLKGIVIVQVKTYQGICQRNSIWTTEKWPYFWKSLARLDNRWDVLWETEARVENNTQVSNFIPRMVGEKSGDTWFLFRSVPMRINSVLSGFGLSLLLATQDWTAKRQFCRFALLMWKLLEVTLRYIWVSSAHSRWSQAIKELGPSNSSTRKVSVCV